MPRRTIAMSFKTRFLVPPAACLCLTMFGAGCDNSRVNEAGSPVPEGSAASAPKDAQPPPQSYKEYYERTQKATPPGKGAALAKPKDESKK
jgi:hypothetical protein